MRHRYFVLTPYGVIKIKSLSYNASDILTHIDGMAMALLIGDYIEWRKHREALEKEGYSYKTESQDGNVMIRPHPQVAMMADAWKRICRMQAEFSMTPASRSRVNITKRRPSICSGHYSVNGRINGNS